MIELSRHIESLLLKHDCVIVPGLGGFVTQSTPAQYVAEEQLFLPPCQSVAFNPQLTLNDGLLIESYMKTYSTTYPETVKVIEYAVEQIKEELQENGSYSFPGIGELRLTLGNRMDFEPFEAGVLSPKLYGLDAIHLCKVSPETTDEDDASNEAHQNKSNRTFFEKSEKVYTFRLPRELVNYTAAAIIAIVFYFVWATPLNQATSTETQEAGSLYTQLFSSSTSHSSNQEGTITNPVKTSSPQNDEVSVGSTEVQPLSSESEKINDSFPTPSESSSSITEKARTNPETTSTTNTFTLVLASMIPEKNANQYAEQLQAQGLTQAKSFKRGKMVRVIYGSYADEEEARQELRQLRRSNPIFREAWVLRVQ